MESDSQHGTQVVKAIRLIIRLLKTIRFREDATLTHTVDTDAVDGLLMEIMEDPPPLMRKKEPAFAASAIEIEPDGQEE